MTLWTVGLLPTPSGEVFGTFCATQDENQSAKTEASSAAEKLVAYKAAADNSGNVGGRSCSNESMAGNGGHAVMAIMAGTLAAVATSLLN